MSLISYLKHAMGLEADDGEEFVDDDSEAVTAETVSPPETPSDSKSSETTEVSVEIAPIEAHDAQPPQLPMQLFDAVIALFNDFQPQFVKECLDSEAQRKYIISHIDESLRQSIQAEMTNGRALGLKSCDAERQKMATELAQLRAMKQTLEQQHRDATEKRLSADRQKRALKDRVVDLEGQVRQLEAEKEQYEIQCRSMANKLRAAGVTNPTAAGDPLPDPLQAVIDEQKALIEDLNSRLTQAQADNQKLTEEIDEAKKCFDMLAQIEKEVERFEDIKKANDKRIANLQRTCDQKTAEIAELQAQLEERTARVSELQASIAAMQMSAVQTSSKPYKSEEEMVAEAPVEKPVDMAAENPPAEIQRPAKKRRGRKPAITAIDDLMEATDWLVAAEPTPKRSRKENTDDDFGYKEPPARKSTPDDDLQLSLW